MHRKNPIVASLALGVEIRILGGPAGHDLLVVEDGATVEAPRGRRHPQLHGNRARRPLRHLEGDPPDVMSGKLNISW